MGAFNNNMGAFNNPMGGGFGGPGFNRGGGMGRGAPGMGAMRGGRGGMMGGPGGMNGMGMGGMPNMGMGAMPNMGMNMMGSMGESPRIATLFLMSSRFLVRGAVLGYCVGVTRCSAIDACFCFVLRLLWFCSLACFVVYFALILGLVCVVSH